MGQLLYFTRHGKLIPGELLLSEEGRAELGLVGERLKERGFKPNLVFTSPELRCVDSVPYFTDTLEVIRDQALEASGTVDMLRKFRAPKFLPRLLDFAQGKDALVVSHDCVASVLGLCLAEMRGTQINWQDEKLRHQVFRLERGHGVLVIDGTYEFVSP